MGNDKSNRTTKKAHAMTRRNWLRRVGLGAGSAVVSGLTSCNGPRGKLNDREQSRLRTTHDVAPERAPDYYPPAKTGLRGDNPGSFDAAHLLRKGSSWEIFGSAADTSEHYDLVVVGGGISGLSAAHFYRKRFGSGVKILVLESHDDIGGHATRNEFTVSGRLLVSYGGSQSIAGPSSFSNVSQSLMQDLVIDASVFEQAFDRTLYAKLDTGVFFDRETYGKDQLLTGLYRKPWKQLLAKSPLSAVVRRDIERVYTEKVDYLAGRSQIEKIELLKKTSYRDFLSRYCNVVEAALVYFQSFSHDLFGIGIDGVSAWSCYHGVDDFGAFLYPGFDGLGLPPLAPSEPYIHHFPDGNASVARLLVRALVPAALPGNSMHDVVLAKLDYSRLDQAESPVRIRLNSTVVHTRHQGLEMTTDRDVERGDVAQLGRVEVVYSRGGATYRVTAQHCVLACYNSMIPYICPELPRAQRKALSYLVRMPFVYAHVALRNWKPFADLGIHQVTAPNSYFSYVALDFPVSLGAYQCPKQPDEPAVLFLLRVPCRPGLTRRDQNRVGRWELLNTDLSTYEHHVRDQLTRMLSATNFDASRDIMGVTINRWAHGYAFVPNRLFDPQWSDDDKPWVVGRQPWGRFTIANSDAGASAYMDVAIDEAWRAVQELNEA